MEIRTNLEVGQKTQLVMTARMQQSLRMLQAPGLELAEMLREALGTNPFLEEDPPEQGEAGLEEVREAEGKEAVEAAGAAEDWNQRDPLSGEDSAVPVAPWGREVRGWADRPQAAPEPWQEAILRQVRLRPDGEQEAPIAEYLLGCLDERGYLAASVEEIAAAAGASPARVERVRRIVLRLDPPGLGARDLKECLIVQLQECGEADSLARRIVETALPDLARRRLRGIAAQLRVSEEEVRGATERIRQLWPHPRRLIERASVEPIYPDLRVERVDGSYEVLADERLFPKVRFSPPGERLLRRQDERLRAFVNERVARARWLMGSLGARRRTLVGLMKLIVEEQEAFFEKGQRHLKPLGYRHMADRMGLHESTIARAVRGKYVQTPRGLFPLRFFFSKGLRTSDGDGCCPVCIRTRIRELIKAEEPARPLTDEELTQILRCEGLRIARRTVAKYRDRMRILKASYRKTS